MFVSSPYSAFFNSGLLARANTPRSRTRRSSLPDSTTPRTSSSHKSTSAYYVARQHRDEREHRSFLSLDLAESRLSERHGPQTESLIPPVPALPPLTLPVVSPLSSHFSSSDSITSILLPDPKPPPTIMLPDLPPPPYSIHHTHQRSPPRLPELPVLPALQLPTYSKKPQRPLPSPPSPLSPLSPPTDDDDDPSPPLPRSSVLTKPKHLRSKKPKNLGILTDPINLNRHSKASVSTASTRVRRKNRWDALHTLEGKKPNISPPDPLPFLHPPKKKFLKLENVFVNPSTFARPTPPKPLPRPNPKSNIINRSKRVVPNFMSMSDDSDPEPNHSSSSYSDHQHSHQQVYLHQNLPLDINPLLEPEDIVLPPPVPIRPRPPSAEFNTRSYLDVEADNEDEEEGIVLEATRCPALLSPPPPPTVVTPIIPTSQPIPSQTPCKAPPVKRHPLKPNHSVAGGLSLAAARKDHTIISTTTTKDKDRSKSTKPKHNHQHSSTSRRHKASTSTATARSNAHPPRTNHSHYKSFIELDMDDLLEHESEPVNGSKSHSRKGEDRDAGLELFEWRGRVGRGFAEGGGEWVWV